MKLRNLLLLLLGVGLFSACVEQATTASAEVETAPAGERWTPEQAWAWYESQPWMAGTNFTPSTAINQLEFWQAESFDPETIDRELGWAEELGMNTHRVFLHNLLWEQDSVGFVARIDQFLGLCEKHNQRVFFVLFDDCWNPNPKLGVQPEPKPLTHNSGWVQSPGKAIVADTASHDQLEGYVKGIISRYSNDPRVVCWDIYNEPQEGITLHLLKKAYGWAREVAPSQPLITGLFRRGEGRSWTKPETLGEVHQFMLTEADVLSFHSYDATMDEFETKAEELLSYGRPVMCTEYLARTNNNNFYNALPALKSRNIAAVNWGFVAGKTGTCYPWAKWTPSYVEGTTEPDLWFHDILRTDGTAFDPKEIQQYKRVVKGELE